MPTMMSWAFPIGQQHAELVARVKQFQKTPGGRDQWHAWIEARGGGKRDPALRQTDELREFLDKVGSSQGSAWGAATAQGWQMPMTVIPSSFAKVTTPPADAGGSKFVAESAEHADAIARVKACKKSLEDGHERWLNFLEKRGGGKRDPAARTLAELHEFLQENDPQGTTASVRGNFDKTQLLVNRIKKGQGQSQEFKEAWWHYCDERGNNVRDPTRHDEAFLQSFMDIAPAVQTFESDDNHQSLVNQVKMGQRMSEDFKKQWWSYCDEQGEQKRDPARHDRAFLEKFLMQTGAGQLVPGGQIMGNTMRFSPY